MDTLARARLKLAVGPHVRRAQIDENVGDKEEIDGHLPSTAIGQQLVRGNGQVFEATVCAPQLGLVSSLCLTSNQKMNDEGGASKSKPMRNGTTRIE